MASLLVVPVPMSRSCLGAFSTSLGSPPLTPLSFLGSYFPTTGTEVRFYEHIATLCVSRIAPARNSLSDASFLSAQVTVSSQRGA